jgi:hypothetical protein
VIRTSDTQIIEGTQVIIQTSQISGSSEGTDISVDIGEEWIEEYLRLNGFFLIRRFTIHFVDKNPSDVDFIGVRMPGSVEVVEDEADPLQSEVFEDDPRLQRFLPPECIALLIAEVTLSHKKSEIEKRISRLKDRNRVEYILRRLGVHVSNTVSDLLDGKIVDSDSLFKSALIRILFLHTEKLVEKYQKENPELVLLSWANARNFVKRRSRYKIKARGVHNLPRNVQSFIRSRQQ